MPPRLSLPTTQPLHIRSRPPLPTASFHTSKPWRSDNIDPYETLQVPYNASPASIKKQFYALSTLHHPDHNPNDPSASDRFVKISSAYAILGHTDARARYDREHNRHSSPSHPSRPGTYSSTTAPYGARPASGLSKRPTQFRGPPPSFYRSGGWGAHAAKRAAAYDANPSPSSPSASSPHPHPSHPFHPSNINNNTTPRPGNPQTMRAGWNDVPHFNREGHLWTQEQHERRRQRRREEESAGSGRSGGGGMVGNFLVVTAVVVLAGFVPGLLGGGGVRRREEDGYVARGNGSQGIGG